MLGAEPEYDLAEVREECWVFRWGAYDADTERVEEEAPAECSRGFGKVIADLMRGVRVCGGDVVGQMSREG